jgi:hypothetical protein
LKSISAIILIAACLTRVSLAGDDALRDGFANPPLSAHPQTWWHWMNGNVTREGISADLEAMHRVGIQEANIITVASDIPKGPVPVMSPAFFDMVEFAAKEADRLGMTLCMDNCPGWSSSGGPWVKPEHAMQFVVSSETKVTGPMQFSAVLSQPPTKENFYRDIAVLAFKTPSGEEPVSIAKWSPKITSTTADIDGALLIDGDPKTFVSMPSPSRAKPQVIRIEFPQPVQARALALTAGPKCPDCDGKVDFSDDGVHFKPSKPFNLHRNSAEPVIIPLANDTVSARFFRIEFTSVKSREPVDVTLAEISFTRQLTVQNISKKAVYGADATDPKESLRAAAVVATPDQLVHRDGIVNLTTSLKPDGTLTWDVPAGNWTVLRFGYTPTGVTNHPAPPEATGLECDKLSKEGLDASWNGMMQPLLDRLGPLGGKVLVDCLIDSYETGGQNWTPKMTEEFIKHRGYDPTPYLPVLTGRMVDSPEITERFLWDWRRTVGDLFAENYFDYFAELCHKHGMKSLVEPYTGPFEGLACGRAADVPMGEFWAGSEGQTSLKLASSVGHTYGQPIIGAESFTGAPDHGRWTDDPYSLKALGDLAFCEGINKYIFHRFAHQPWMDRFPGMTMGQWGINLDRTNTWFEKAKPWMDYISRSQYLLQQGKFFADVAYFSGESTPEFIRAGSNPVVPKGYDYDGINADVLLKSSVQNHRLVLPDGMSYALLALSSGDPEITPPVLEKIRDLIKGGLTVLGDRPTRSPSLQDYPVCDQKVTTLSQEIWADCDGKTVTEHVLGDGKVVAGKPLVDLLAEMKLPPDFACGDPVKKGPCLFIHRQLTDGDAYFVANHVNSFESVNCTFRITGKVPELWHPDTNTIETAPVYEEANGVTTVPLQLDPVGSVFVVFRRSSAGAAHVVEVSRTASPGKAVTLEVHHATYEAVDGTGSLDVTATLSGMVHDGLLSAAVDNTTFGQDPTPDHVKQCKLDVIVNGKPESLTIPENQRIELSAAGPLGVSAAYQLRTANDGSVEIFQHDAESIQLKVDTGEVLRSPAFTTVKTPVAGGWDLSFPPKWGAPPSVHLDELISWTEHSDPGVKYFSGTATYTRQIDVPREMIGKTLFLNLGTVKNFAQVTINGKDLGILWKPPFTVDISNAVTAGPNKLEIQVTNLWPNRIIGDAQLPEDTQWAGMRPAGWPQFLLDDKPSPTGRLTFTTWRHWTKAGALLQSGLIGPVVIESGSWQKPIGAAK